VFRRRREPAADPDDDDQFDDEWTDDPDEPASTAPEAGGAPQPAAAGPWDLADAPDDGVQRVDLGGLRVPVLAGVELRVDVQDNLVAAATFVDGASALQVAAFAAPKTAGIWAEVRDEIATSLRASGGSADTATGPFGPELRARIPVQAAGHQRPNLQPARFFGVDGPRWFLRGLLTGPAVDDAGKARRLLAAFRAVVVVRGGDAMAPRDQLPLRLPREMLPEVEPPAGAEPENPYRAGADPLRRGPEITETR
jgi:hypothetical protein